MQDEKKTVKFLQNIYLLVVILIIMP